MTPDERLSVRELIAALARLEDELRVAGSPTTHDTGRERRLAAREQAILEELRRRSPDFACGAGPVADAAVPPVVESAEEAFTADPDAGAIGHATEGEDLGESLLGARRVPQDDVGGTARGRS